VNIERIVSKLGQRAQNFNAKEAGEVKKEVKSLESYIHTASMSQKNHVNEVLDSLHASVLVAGLEGGAKELLNEIEHIKAFLKRGDKVKDVGKIDQQR
jgi:hypothetical protein